MEFRPNSRAPRCSDSSARLGQIGFLTLRRYKFWLMHSTQLGKPFKRAAPLLSQNDPSKLRVKYWQKASSKTPRAATAISMNCRNLHSQNCPVESEGSTASPLPKSMRQQTAFSTSVRQILPFGLVWPGTNLTTFSLSRAGVREMAAARDYQRFSARSLEAARRTDDPQHRAFLVEMAQAWRRLAEEAMSSKGAQVVCSAPEPDRGD